MKTDLLFTTVIRLVLRNDNKNYFLSSEKFEENEIKEIKNGFNITNDIITLEDIIKAYESKKDYFNSIGIYFNTSETFLNNSTVFITSGRYGFDGNGTSVVEVFGSALVYVYGSVNVFAHDSAEVCAYESAHVACYGSSSVFAFNNSKVRAYDSATVKTYDNARKIA